MSRPQEAGYTGGPLQSERLHSTRKRFEAAWRLALEGAREPELASYWKVTPSRSGSLCAESCSPSIASTEAAAFNRAAALWVAAPLTCHPIPRQLVRCLIRPRRRL